MSPAGIDTARRTCWVPGLVLVLGFLLLTAGPVLIGFDHFPSKSIDMTRNHVPVIEAFAAEWPAPELGDYDSATTPGMHLLLAAMVRVLGPSETLLQLATCLFGAGLIGVAWWFGTRVVGGWMAAACLLPLALSPYVLGNAIWVMTDNLSLALVAVSIGVAIFIRPSWGSASVSSIFLVLAVLVRQINVWPTALAWCATMLGQPGVRRRLSFRDELDEGATLGPPVILGGGGMLAFLVLGGFVLLWGGLVPPSFQPGGGGVEHSGGLNLAVAPFVLTLLGAYAIPALIVFLPMCLEDPRVRRAALWGAAVGLLVGIALHSAPGKDLGRVGGWVWTLAERLPVVGGRSVVLVLGAILGGFTAGCFFGLLASAGRSRAGWLLIGFGASFIAAYTANAQVFQRYFDPPVLLALGWGLALTVGARTSAGPLGSSRVAVAALGMAAMQAVFAAATLYLKLGFDPGAN